MIRNKGKHRYFLYNLRRQEKLRRNRKKNKASLKRKGKTNSVERNFVGNNYSKVISHLESRKFMLPKLKNKSKGYENIIIPEVFSISEDAESVIKLIREIYTIAKNTNTKSINFDHCNCVNLGLAASTIMDVILLAVDKYREKKGFPLDYSGNLPRNSVARDILLAGGLPYHLNAESRVHYDVSQVERLTTICGEHDMYANKAGETATKLTNYFNKCLKTQNMELNDEGKRVLSCILGEVISNCEIHGGDIATWYTQGHYQMKDNNSYGEMQLLFLNIGDTIYEGLKNSSSDETKEKLSHVMKMHHKYLTKDWDEEAIYTVFALQEGISRLRDKMIQGYEGRGSGTVSMIEMFNDIGESKNGLKPQMTIVSGKTQIKFSENYKMKTERFVGDAAFGTGEKRIIAFNGENDIYQPADSHSVKKISEYFPGTVISLKFYLDSRYIISKKQKG